MKYIAIIDDEFLSNFRVDTKLNADLGADMVLVVEDKTGCTRGIQLKPLQRAMVVTDEGNSAYLRQEHIDCLIEMETKEMCDKMFDKMVQDIKKRFGLTEEDIDDRAETTD